MTARHEFTVDGMHCSSCVMLIDEVVEELPGVRRSHTSLRKRRTVVEFDPAACSPDLVIDAIAEAGYAASLAAKR